MPQPRVSRIDGRALSYSLPRSPFMRGLSGTQTETAIMKLASIAHCTVMMRSRAPSWLATWGAASGQRESGSQLTAGGADAWVPRPEGYVEG
jgi:hypothetical protein